MVAFGRRVRTGYNIKCGFYYIFSSF